MSGFKAFNGFEALIDQEQPVHFLTTILRRGTIPHALLFTGIEGIGKRTAAISFAMACNCAGSISETKSEGETGLKQHRDQLKATGSCGRCRSCRKILSGNHPDIILIEPSGSLIKISQIRDLCLTLASKPYEGRMRVVIIAGAQMMNPEASNALLKVLEEPPDRTIFILTALQPADLLATIISRCHHIRFNPVSQKDIEQYLVETEGVNPDKALIISAIANGSLSKAATIAGTDDDSEDWVVWRNRIINEADAISSSPVVFLLGFAERLSQKKEVLTEALEIIKTYFRDILIAKYDTSKIINRDLIEKIQTAGQRISSKKLINMIDMVQAAQKKIKANTNVRLTLETMLLKMSEKT